MNKENKIIFGIYVLLCFVYLLFHYDQNVNPFLKASPILFLWAFSFERKTFLRFLFPLFSFFTGLVYEQAMHFLDEKSVILVLTIFGFLMTFEVKKNLLAYSLIFSAAVDMFLATSFFGENAFFYGLGSFLVAHLFYIRIFYLRWQKKKVSVYKKLLIVAVWGGSFGMLGLFFPILEKTLFFIVTAYVFVITMMVSLSILSEKIPSFAWVGAFLFFFSDAIIGINKFYFPVPYEHFLVMLLYYSAQLNLFAGLSSKGTDA